MLSTDPRRAAADRNLLFGILAVQLDFVDRDSLIAAMNAWVLDKEKSLGQVLADRGVLPFERRALLDALVDEHLRQHGNDPQRSLEAVAAHSTVSADLAAAADPDLQATLTQVDPHARIFPGRAAHGRGHNGGRYRRIRPHARGGLGQVFVAEDTELHREVAVKEIQPERADDPSSRTRFILEAEITGALEHPGIVPVYGLGAYADGRPFYAMRFIRGDSLKAAIDQFHAQDWSTRPVGERALAFRSLLRRLIDACNAVAYAHSRGVLHRDLKPQNVMLGKFGETLVLDWGLAKIGIEPQKREAHEATTDPVVRPSSGSENAGTLAGAALGTPGYMSPEQAAGRLDLLCPASDVYSLGATLYVLLTGERPSSETSTLPDFESGQDALRRGSPGPRPPAALMAVCDKARAADPVDRYQTPLDLAADLERWLADEPVSVYADPWPVRAARWGRRHRTTVAAGLVFLVSSVAALLIGAGLLWHEERKTTEQKREAEENYELARRMSGGIELIASSEAELAADPVKHAARKEVLTAAATAFRKHLERNPTDPEVRRQAARVYRYAANVHRLEREYGAAEPLYRDAIELLEGLATENKNESTYRLQLCETLRDQASVRSTLGGLADAITALNRVIDIADELSAMDSKNPAHRRARAAGLLNRSTVEYLRGNLGQAGLDAARAAELYRTLDQVPADAHPYDGLLRGAALNVMAMVERESGRPEKAATLHSEAVGLLAKLATSDRPGLNRDDVLDVRSSLLLEQCRTLKSKPALRKQVETILTGVARQWELLAANNKTIPQYRQSSGVAYYERGLLRAEDGRVDEARADLKKSLDILKREADRSPDIPALSADLGRTCAGLARLARASNDHRAAAEWFDQARAALRAAVDWAPERARDRGDLNAVEAEMR